MAVKKEHGFTIIELLVVIAVITVLPTIIIVNFPKIRLQFSLSRVAHKFAQDVRRAQNMALSSVPYVDSLGVPRVVGGYGIYINTSVQGGWSRYTIYADRPPINYRYDATDYTVEVVDFATAEPGVIIQRFMYVVPPSLSVHFAPPNPTTTIVPTPTQNVVEVVFALPSLEWQEKAVSINTSGLIEVK